ncbi:ribonuclease H-like domain-containing protein [Tanacetum coccineum]
MTGSDDENTPPPPPTQQAPHTVSTIKLPILKKGEYDIWAMKMKHYLSHTDYPIWEVLPPKTAKEILASERERKARTTLLMALAKYGDTRPEDEFERVLYGDLRVMFEPDIKSDVWRMLQGYRVTTWKLIDSSGVHFVRFDNLHIFMLVERRYPLTPITITNMLNKKLQTDHQNEMCYQLLKLMIQKMNIKFRGGLLGLKRLHGFLEVTAAQIWDQVRENNDAPIIEDWVSDDEEQDESMTKLVKKTVIPTAAKIEKPVKKSVRYAKMYRSQRPRGNQRNWNGQKKRQRKRMMSNARVVTLALPNEHQLTFSQYPYAKSMFATIEIRFGVVWMNKPEIKTMSIDDLYNNFKIVEQKIKKTVGTSSGVQNLAFMTAPSSSSTNDANTASSQVSAASPSVNTVSPQVCTAIQIHEDDLEAMDLKWQLSLLSVRAKKYYQKTGKKIIINGNDIAGYDKSKVECYSCHKLEHFARECRASRSKEDQFRNQDNTRKQGNKEDTSKEMLDIDGVGCESNTSKNVSEVEPKKVRKNNDAPIIEDWVSDDEEQDESKNKPEKKTVIPTTAKNRENQSYRTPVNTVRLRVVNTARSNRTSVNAARTNGFNAGKPQHDDKGFVDNRCSRHMTGNITYLSDFKYFDGGYVAFGGGAYGGKISWS